MTEQSGQLGFSLATRGGRIKAYADFLFKDHAVLRLGFRNAHWISDELVRTNQPWPHQLDAWRRAGLKTVINLRGRTEASSHLIEREACARLGLTLVDFRMSSKAAPTREQVLGAKALFETIAYPALMHCKSGADRTGVMAVLYLHFRRGQPIREATRQLSLRYLHLRHGRPGVLDEVFARYLAEVEPTGVSFEDWVTGPAYDPAAIGADYARKAKLRGLFDALVRRE
jgi:protein tyrosine/serine phosphatase